RVVQSLGQIQVRHAVLGVAGIVSGDVVPPAVLLRERLTRLALGRAQVPLAECIERVRLEPGTRGRLVRGGRVVLEGGHTEITTERDGLLDRDARVAIEGGKI